MKGQFYIDDVDAYLRFGVFVTKDSYSELVAFPALKSVEGNDWPEEDGKEFDLSSPALNTETVSIELAFTSGWKFGDFLGLLSDMAYHNFRFTALGRTYRLRLASQSGYELFPGLSTAKFTFADDFPRDAEYTYQEPVNTIAMPSGYELDGRDLSDYGVLFWKAATRKYAKHRP